MKILRKEDLTRIGYVNKTSGFKGNLNCFTDVSFPEKLLHKKFFFLILEGLPVPYAIESIEMKGDDLVVKFEDVDSEEQAKKLIRKEIYADKNLKEKKNDLLSWKDLVGYFAIDNYNGDIGIITEVLEYPQQMIAKCMVDGKEILFPLNESIVLEIEDDEKKVYVELPDGLIDLYLK